MTIKVKAVRSISASNISFKKFFNVNEQKSLNDYKVKTAIDKVVETWQTHQKSGEQLAVRLEAARKAMVAGHSPKSLFSKWLKFVGIPRATAYWTLARYGKKSTRKQPSIKHLLKMRETSQVELSKAKKDDKPGIQRKLDSIKSQLARRREVLENRIKTLGSDLKELVRGIAAFGEAKEAVPVAAAIADTIREIGFAPSGMTGPMCEFNLDGTVDVTLPTKKPSASVGPVGHQARA